MKTSLFPAIVSCVAALAVPSGLFAAEETLTSGSPKQPHLLPDEVNLGSWPGLESDTTKAMQEAFDSGAKRVIVPNIGKPYLVDPIVVRSSDQEIIFEPGVEVRAKPGKGYASKWACLFTLHRARNVIIRGKGATFVMDRRHFPREPKSEWRHGLSIIGCHDLLVEGLTIRGTGGDGIYIHYALKKGEPPEEIVQSKGIIIRDVKCIANYRQGISIISGEDILIEKSIFADTRGTPPAAGIDLEPNDKHCVLKNIVVRDCVARGNQGSGFMVYLGHLLRHSEPVSIEFQRCVVEGGGWGLIASAIGEGEEGVTGSVRFLDCEVKDTEKGGIYVYDKAADSAEVIFENCRLENVARDEIRSAATPDEALGASVATRLPPPQAPIVFYLRQRANLPRINVFGGVRFIGCEVADREDRPVVGIGTALTERPMVLKAVAGEIRTAKGTIVDTSNL